MIVGEPGGTAGQGYRPGVRQDLQRDLGTACVGSSSQKRKLNLWMDSQAEQE